MHGIESTDGSRKIDWGKTSRDYAAWRPDYPARFYHRLRAAGVGLRGQSIVDLGTGVGCLARQFARQGASVTGIDISVGQIEAARKLASSEDLSIDFRVGPAERTGLPEASADAVTASQCWLYFDAEAAIHEVHRLLRPGGVLVTCHLCWLPLQDPIARASEALVLKHNPDWSAAGWSGTVPGLPPWAGGCFELDHAFVFDAPIAFTRASWRGRFRACRGRFRACRGRFRACRGVGASMSRSEVEVFDRAHERLLRRIAGETFSVLHRVDAHVMRPLR